MIGEAYQWSFLDLFISIFLNAKSIKTSTYEFINKSYIFYIALCFYVYMLSIKYKYKTDFTLGYY